MAGRFEPSDITPGPPSPYIQKLEHVATLKPGRWHRLAEFESKDGAKAQLFRLRKSTDIIPPGKWEFAVQRVDDGSRLMVKYHGKARKAEVSWWRHGRLVTEVPEEEAKAKSAGAQKRWTGADVGKGRMTKEEKRRANKRARG